MHSKGIAMRYELEIWSNGSVVYHDSGSRGNGPESLLGRLPLQWKDRLPRESLQCLYLLRRDISPDDYFTDVIYEERYN